MENNLKDALEPFAGLDTPEVDSHLKDNTVVTISYGGHLEKPLVSIYTVTLGDLRRATKVESIESDQREHFGFSFPKMPNRMKDLVMLGPDLAFLKHEFSVMDTTDRDLPSEIAAKVMALPWTWGGTEDEQADRHGDVQIAVYSVIDNGRSKE